MTGKVPSPRCNATPIHCVRHLNNTDHPLGGTKARSPKYSSGLQCTSRLLTPSSAVSKQQPRGPHSGVSVGAPPCPQTRTAGDKKVFNTVPLASTRYMTTPGHTLIAGNPAFRPSEGTTGKLRHGSGATPVGAGRYTPVMQTLMQPHTTAKRGHAVMQQFFHQDTHAAALNQGTNIRRRQQVPVAPLSLEESADERRERRSNLPSSLTSEDNAIPTELSRIPAHVFEAFKLQLGKKSPAKRMHQLASKLSSGSTCSSVSSLRRPGKR